MRRLTAAELLEAWENSIAYPAFQRDLNLLGAACPEYSSDELKSLSIGRRDGLLLTLREWIFGTRLTALADCPACGVRAELEMSTAEIRMPQQPELPAVHELAIENLNIHFRLPNGNDLASLAARRHLEDGRSFLLQCCILSVEKSGGSEPKQNLSQAAISAVIQEMARLDSQADVRLELNCPACARQWSEPFNIGLFFWEELQRWALRLLGEVHSLATAYGWREADILSMSSRRRQLYLQMIGHE